MREFLFDLFIDQMVDLLPRPVRIALSVLVGSGLVALLIWLLLK